MENIGEDKKVEIGFVLMPFNDKLNPVYDRIIEPVMKDFGLICLRSDKINKSTPITKDILDNIKKANVLIADLTDKNPNVYYEVGYAHAIGRFPILITQNIDNHLFDIKDYRAIIYEDSVDGLNYLRNELKKYIEEIKVKSLKKESFFIPVRLPNQR